MEQIYADLRSLMIAELKRFALTKQQLQRLPNKPELSKGEVDEVHAVQVVVDEELEHEWNVGLMGLEGPVHDSTSLMYTTGVNGRREKKRDEPIYFIPHQAPIPKSFNYQQ